MYTCVWGLSRLWLFSRRKLTKFSRHTFDRSRCRLITHITHSASHSITGQQKVVTYFLLFNLVVWLVATLFFTIFSLPILAQMPIIEPGETRDQPKIRSTVVSASVPDIVPPSTPILISPLNHAVLTNNQVSLVFQGSTDNVGVDHYQLWLDGQLLFADLNPLGEMTAQYTLTIIDGKYTLQPTLAIPDGDHTWKVVAADAAGNQTNSATWQFSLDSQAPIFLITNVDGQIFSISAQDLLTIPTTPIPVSSANPILSGLGETNSTGVVSIAIPGQATQLITFSLSGTGAWQIQLPFLPYDTIVTLNFTITDAAGNVSVISDLKLIRPSLPSVTPAPTAIVMSGTPIPAPIVTPMTDSTTPLPSLPPVPFPLPPLPFPIPSPVQPIVERVTRLGLTPRALLARMMPVSAMASWQRPSLSLFQVMMPILSILNWLWLILPLLICFGWLGRYLPRALTWAGLRQLWWAVGFDSQALPRGVVMGLPQVKLLSFATLTTISKLPSGQTEISYRLSNRWGEYLPAKLPNGTHQLVVNQPGYLFPAVFNVPAHQQFSSYYLGETWTTDDRNSEPYLIIPLLATDRQARQLPPDWLLNLVHQQSKAVLGQVILLLITFSLIPSLLNGLAVLVLVMLITIKRIKKASGQRSTTVYSRNLEPIQTGAMILDGSDELKQVMAINAGKVTQAIDQRLMSASTQICRAVITQDDRVQVVESICSITKDQVVVST